MPFKGLANLCHCIQRQCSSHIPAIKRTVLYLCLLAMEDKPKNCRSLAHEGQWLNECHPQTSLGDTIQQHDIWRHVLQGAQLWRNIGMLTSWGRSAACVDRPFVSLRRYTELLYRGHSFWWRLSECFCAHKKLKVRNNGYLKCYGKAFLHRKRT